MLRRVHIHENSHEGHRREQHIKTSSLLGLVGNGLEAAAEQNPPDVEESNAADGKPSPLGPLTRSPSRIDKGRDQASDNHEDIGENSKDSLVRRKTGNEAEREQKKWGGEQPIDGTGVEKLAVKSEVASVMVVVWHCDPRLSESCGHGKVGSHGHGQNQGGQPVVSGAQRDLISDSSNLPVEEPSTLLYPLRENENTDNTKGEQSENDPKGSLTDMGVVDILVYRGGLSSAKLSQPMATEM